MVSFPSPAELHELFLLGLGDDIFGFLVLMWRVMIGNNVPLEDDLHNAHNEAANNAGSSGNSELFSNVMNVISQKKGDLAENPKVDEQGKLPNSDRYVDC